MASSTFIKITSAEKARGAICFYLRENCDRQAGNFRRLYQLTFDNNQNRDRKVFHINSDAELSATINLCKSLQSMFPRELSRGFPVRKKHGYFYLTFDWKECKLCHFGKLYTIKSIIINNVNRL